MAAFSDALGTSGTAPGKCDITELDHNNDKNVDDYEDDVLLEGKDKDNDGELLVGADDSPENENSHWVHLFNGVVYTKRTIVWA